MPKILVIDDDEAFRKMLRLTLIAMGHDVSEARHGAEALRLLSISSPDLIITDLIMPEKEGVETIMEIQKLHPHLKIIAMSGGARISSKQLLQMTGQLCSVPTIAKPFSNRDLAARISSTLEPGAK